jgi:hypothetical protein
MEPNVGPSQTIAIVFHLYDADLMNLLMISNCPISLSQLLHQPIAGIEYDDALRTDLPTASLKEVLHYPNCG